jgi:putative tryptophan/tyrosine transport system substrate-binding protein
VRRRNFITLLSAAATAWPLAGRAQQSAMPVIGFLGAGSPGPNVPFIAAFRQGLSEAGWVERQNLAIEYRWAEGHYDRLPAFAAEFVGRKVDLILATGGNHAALAAKNGTVTIPIVFVTGDDPVADGVVASLPRPGGNLTGFTMLVVELSAKKLDLITELVPRTAAVALLVNPKYPNTERIIQDTQQAARAKGVRLHVLKAANEAEIDNAFSALVELHAGGLLLGSDPFFFSRREQIVALASRQAIPAIYSVREYAAAGGLISYGASLSALHREAGVYAGRILKGEKPTDLPVQQPTTFELVINLNTAKALGLTVPPSILARADEVIE